VAHVGALKSPAIVITPDRMTRRLIVEERRETPFGANSVEDSRPLSIRVITHNIRYATQNPFKGEELWPIRCPLLCSELVFNSNNPATFICLQEVLHSQLVDILHSLNKSATTKSPDSWSYIGVGRDDGKMAGE
jgi:hypothetical protein